MHPCAQGKVSDSAVDANLAQPNPHASSNVKDSPFKEGGGEEKGDASVPVSHCCRSIASSACGVPVCPPLSPPRPVALVLH